MSINLSSLFGSVLLTADLGVLVVETPAPALAGVVASTRPGDRLGIEFALKGSHLLSDALHFFVHWVGLFTFLRCFDLLYLILQQLQRLLGLIQGTLVRLAVINLGI